MKETVNPTDSIFRERYKRIIIVAIPIYRGKAIGWPHAFAAMPVNPTCGDVFKETCYPDLKSVPEKVDVVDIFRKQEAAPGVVKVEHERLFSS